MTNAEAGPSGARPRTAEGPTSFETTTTTTTPVHVKPRRRSWFHFTTPSAKVSGPASRRESMVDNEQVEMSEAGTSRKSSQTVRTMDSGYGEVDEEEELLTIDGDPEQTVKRKLKKKKKRKSGDVEDGVALRMEELGPSSSRMVHQSSRRPMAYDPGGENVKPNPIVNRAFSRRASERDPFALPSTDSRSSSDTHPPSPQPSSTSSLQPRIETYIPRRSLDRALPRLPLSEQDKQLPDVPRGIVVTPSSPRKSDSPLTSATSSFSSITHLASERPSRSTTRSTSSTATRQPRSAQGSPVGLGHPSVSRSPSNRDSLVPFPPKFQSVSSPLPSRTDSPTHKITFIEPDETTTEDPPRSTQTSMEEKSRMRRSRSLSNLLGKNTPVPMENVRLGTRPHTPEPGDDDEEIDPTTSVKASGVLGWLGMKRIVKRRQSEGRLRNVTNGSANEAPPPPLPTDDKDKVTVKSRQSVGLHQELGEVMRSRPIGQHTEATHSDITSIEWSTSKKPGLLTRRISSRGTSPAPEPVQNVPVPAVETRPISINAKRPSTSSSSQSSLRLPSFEAYSPRYWHGEDRHATSPSPVEGEETLFSPESGAHWGRSVRPWLDETDGHSSTRTSMSFQLDSLPERAQLNVPDTALRPALTIREGRIRSWSNPPLSTPNAQNSHTPIVDPASEADRRSLLQSPPLTPDRPKMPGRSNSGNSAVIEKMRTVFSKRTTRGRSNSAVPPHDGLTEFRGMPHDSSPQSSSFRPSSSSSSVMTSRSRSGTLSKENSRLALLDLTENERHIFLNDNVEKSARTSLAATSMSSIGTAATRQSVLLDTASTAKKGRAKASTLSSGPSSYSFVAPSSPHLFPLPGTPPRRRPSVMQRISNGVLRSGPSSPRGGSLFPLPARSTGSTSSGITGGNAPSDDNLSTTFSSATSPRPSAGSIAAAMSGSLLKAATAREGEETPQTWLDRVSTQVGRDELSNVLASSGDEFFEEALRLYMSRFDFTHNALDVALRRLLMQMTLPRETQQIDRIIEAFAVRYEECEPGLFLQKDNTYVLAFSMMMLHTDAFNRHNKNKMSKADYVRNTRMDGVPPLVLEAFFDNITFTPFVFIEDDSDLLKTSTIESNTIVGSATPRNGKVDVYHMIVLDLLGSLRVDMEMDIPVDSPFSCLGTRPFLNTDELHRAFIHARNLPIVPPRRKNSAAALLGSTPGRSTPQVETHLILKVTKVGLLSRKDDGSEGGKKSSRKWKSWGVILTGSQLVFFKDPACALTLMAQVHTLVADQANGSIYLPKMINFKPDEVFPVKDCVAVFDRALASPNSFRFIMPPGRQYLLQATDESGMNEWVSLINYASAFKTAGVRMQGSSMGKDRAVLAGAAAAASHKREIEGTQTESGNRTPRKAVFGGAMETPPSVPSLLRTENVLSGAIDVDEANDVVANEGEQLEEVFDEVKAELAAGRGGVTKRPSTAMSNESSTLRSSVEQTTSIHTSRSESIESHIRVFQNKVDAHRSGLATQLRLARNLAILTPFQKSTRDRIASGISSLVHKIRHERLELAKYEVWIMILRKDLESEQRDWARLRHVALQAAAKSLREPMGLTSVVREVNAGGDELPVPTLAFPDNAQEEEEEQGEEDVLGRSPAELPVVIRRPSDELGYEETKTRSRQSSAASATSYRSVTSAMSGSKTDISPSNPSSRKGSPSVTGQSGEHTPMLFALSDVEDLGSHITSPRTKGDDKIRNELKNVNAKPADGYEQRKDTKDNETVTNVKRAVDVDGNRDRDGERDVEQAEDWQKTKAAKRVSLATIPPGIQSRVPSGQSGARIESPDGALLGTANKDGEDGEH